MHLFCYYFHVFTELGAEALATQMHRKFVLSALSLPKQDSGAAFGFAYERKLTLGYCLMPHHCHC